MHLHQRGIECARHLVYLQIEFHLYYNTCSFRYQNFSFDLKKNHQVH